MNNRALFICHTQYQILVTIIKQLHASKDADLIISETVPGREPLAERIKNVHLFHDILLPADEHLPNPPDHGVAKLLLHPVQRRAFRRAGFTLNPGEYSDICIYNDWTPLGRWLQDYGAEYILGEDTRNHFAKPENMYIEAQKNEPGFESRRKHHSGYLYWGGYAGVKQVEVSSAEGVPYYRDRLVIIDPLFLLSQFDNSKLETIRKVFIQGDLPTIQNPACLFLSRSFFVDHEVPSQEAQNQLCRDVVKDYADGYSLVIKTHPRDTTDYTLLFPDAIILDRFMPSELLDYCFTIQFARAVGVCTASVKNLKCADEKIYLDGDVIERYCHK